MRTSFLKRFFLKSGIRSVSLLIVTTAMCILNFRAAKLFTISQNRFYKIHYMVTVVARSYIHWWQVASRL